jgi:hypothetical protein
MQGNAAMDKRLFLQSLKDFDRSWHRLSSWFPAGLLILLFVVVPFGLRQVSRTVVGSVNARLIVYQVTCLAMILGYAALVQNARRAFARKFSLVCGHCAEPFTQADLLEMGYTETCRACGAQVFDDTPATPAIFSEKTGVAQKTPRLKSRAEFLTLMRDFPKCSGQTVKSAIGFVILMTLALLLFMPIAQSGDLAAILWRSAIVLGCLIGFLAYMHFDRRRPARRCGVACPSCRHAFSTLELKYLGYSGQCERCNAHVLL